MTVKKLVVGISMALSAATAHSANELWSLQFIGDFQIARVLNDAGLATGVICSLESQYCRTYVIMPATCTVGANYPMMINSPVGALPISTTCFDLDGQKIYVIDQFDNTISAFESGGEIGFAMPLDNGKFTVARFSTRGASLAIKQARTNKRESAPPPKPKPGTRSNSVQVL